MTHFIVIGTNDKVKNVVDEIEESARLQHNVVSSGCIITEDNGNLTYKWKPLGDGMPTEKGENTHTLKELLKNHLANFGAVLPENIGLRVLIACNCHDDEDVEQLNWIITELLNPSDRVYPSIRVTIALIAYDQGRCHDVNLRPEWKTLKRLKELLDRNPNNVNLLYLNNVDISGGATYINDKLLARFLSLWITMSGNNAKGTINTQVYSIGLAEYQYSFDDLADCFRYDTEAQLLERKLNAKPSEATNACIEKYRLSAIKLGNEWLDGLRHIEEYGKSYCATDYDFTKSINLQPYCVQRQTKEIVDYLHRFIQLHVSRKRHDLEVVKAEIAAIEEELQAITDKMNYLTTQVDLLPDEEKKTASLNPELINAQNQKRTIEQSLARKIQEKEDIEKAISDNSFPTLDKIVSVNPNALVTDSQIAEYENSLNRYKELESFVKSDNGYKLMVDEVENIDDVAKIPCYPEKTIDYIGVVKEPIAAPVVTVSSSEGDETKDNNNSGCSPVAWIVGLFGKKKEEVVRKNMPTAKEPTEELLNKTKENIGKAVNALRKKVNEVEKWWEQLEEAIERIEARKRECIAKVQGYEVKDHRKSRTLIDIERVHQYRKEDADYKTCVGNVLEIWFDNTQEKRPAQDNLIEEKVISQLREKYSELRWDGENPFVDENIDDLRLQEIIDHTSKESKPFIQQGNFNNSNISDSFHFNHPQIEKEPTTFRNKYHTSSGSVSPNYYADFVNSLCAAQIIGIEKPVNDIQDFKPKRETHISTSPADPNFNRDRLNIIGNAKEPKEIARKIYDWLCDNIQYDITKTIHDANTCWKSKKGVCQAYCELFCHIAGDRLTAEVVVGKCKQTDGTVSETLHAWLFVYTNDYDGIFIDPTWGAGGINDGRFVQSVDRDIWFDVAPAWMIYTHYPEKEEWIRLDIKFEEEDFFRLPFKLPDPNNNALDTLTYGLNNLKKTNKQQQNDDEE